MGSRYVALGLGFLAALYVTSARANIVLTEIHYSPVDGAGVPRPDLEFVEVFNDGSEPYDLSGYQFTRGLSFEFPSGSYLGAQSYTVVCRNVDAVKNEYGITNAVGNFSQVLDDAGETIALSNPQGAVVSEVSYNDRGRWPSAARGTGHSLSIKTPYSDASDPDSWTWSSSRGGTPGAQNFADPSTLAPTVLINEALTRENGSGERYVELYNTTAQAIDLSGFFLTDDFLSLTKYAIPGGTVLAAKGHLLFTEAQTGLSFTFVEGVRERISVALTDSAATHVVDAVIFAPTVPGRSEARVPDGDRELQPAVEPTPGATNSAGASSLVILNEIMYSPISGNDLDEYLELYNQGDSAVDLSGWHLEGVGLTFPPGTEIGGKAYLVAARDPERIKSIYGLGPETVHGTPWTGSLRNGGERLKLLDALGNTADEVSYRDGGRWAVWADGGGSSLELIDPHSDNSSPGSWDSSDDSAKSVPATITYGPVPNAGPESDFGMMLAELGIAIIDDVQLVRASDATNTSLIVNGSFEANTTPWRLEGTHTHSGRTANPAEVLNGAGSLKLICWNGSGDYKVNRVEQDTASQTGGPFNIKLTGRWIVGSPRIITIGDYNPNQPNSSGLAGSNVLPVPSNLGTPGAENSVTARQVAIAGTSNLGPSIERVRHSPPVPQANEAVRVTARVHDPDGVASVRLKYRTETPVGAFTELEMTDGDADGIFEATIPGQPLGIRVLFSVEAVDSPGQLERFPTDIFKRTHPPLVDPSAPQPNDFLYCMYRHDVRNVATNHHSYRFIMNEVNENYLLTRKVHSNEMVDCTLVFGTGDVYYNTQLRFAGSPFLRRGNTFNNSYSVRMPKDHPLHERVGAFNLDQHGADGKERISHYLLRQSAGDTILPYYDFHTLARFQLNDVKTGDYEALAKPNGDYISFWFPDGDDGPFFEMDDRFGFNDQGTQTRSAQANVQYPPYGTTGGENKENYRWFFGPRTRESADDFAPLQELCRLLDEGVTLNPEFDATVWSKVDVEELLRVWAIEMNIDDWDTWGGRRGKNCYLYRSSADNLWRLIPWDLELTYGSVDSFPLPSSPTATYSNTFTEIQRLINRPRIKRMYYGLLAGQVNSATGFFRSGFLAPFMGQLQAAGVANTNVGTSNGFIDTRAGLLRNAIRSSIFPQVRLAITTKGGNDFATSAASIDLAGEAPADVFFVVLARNGLQVDPSPEVVFSTSDMKGWTIAGLPLEPGANELQVFGLGSDGNVVDSDTITVLQVDWSAPTLSAVAPDAAHAGDGVTLTGSDFHTGVRVVFGSTLATEVTFDELADPTHIAVVIPSGITGESISVKVVNLDDQESNTLQLTLIPPPQTFFRGDVNLDSSLDLSDAIQMLFHMFAGLAVQCEDAVDADDSGTLNTTDAIVLLEYLFLNGPALPAPATAAGPDPTDDALGCEQGL